MSRRTIRTLTDTLTALAEPGNRLRFILGSGPKRSVLFQALVDGHLGEPLIQAGGATLYGLSDASQDVQKLLAQARAERNLDGFWWTLIGAGLTSVAKWLLSDRRELRSGLDVREDARGSVPRTFLIDGVEALGVDVVEALLRVHSAIENDPTLRRCLRVLVFLDPATSQLGFENFEQQRHGKTVEV